MGVVNVDNIRMAKIFVTVITDDTGISEQRIKEYSLISSLDVPMYAVIKEGVNWDCIKHIPWKKVYCAKTPQDVPMFLNMINDDAGGRLLYT